ncbi:hypothetical protein EDC01DRAFT_630693 [Geopyxis carbonaria]|nr:hypothetical protein EDC01DRAFT_630693 [Geopyxis carbonaria]
MISTDAVENKSYASQAQIAVWRQQNLVKKKAMLLKQQQERQDVIRQQGSGWDIPAVAKNVKNLNVWCSVDVVAIPTNRRQGGPTNIPGHAHPNFIKPAGRGFNTSAVHVNDKRLTQCAQGNAKTNTKTHKYIPSPMEWEALTPGWTVEQIWYNIDNNRTNGKPSKKVTQKVCEPLQDSNQYQRQTL